MDGLKQSLEKAIEELREKQPVTRSAPEPAPGSIEAALASAPSVSPNYVRPPQPKVAKQEASPQQPQQGQVTQQPAAGQQTANRSPDVSAHSGPAAGGTQQPSAGQPTASRPPDTSAPGRPTTGVPQQSQPGRPPQSGAAAPQPQSPAANSPAPRSQADQQHAQAAASASTPPTARAASEAASGQASTEHDPHDLKNRMSELMSREFSETASNNPVSDMAAALPTPDKLSFKVGDVDGDGDVDMADYAKAAKDKIWRWATIGISCAGGLASGWAGSMISDQVGQMGASVSKTMVEHVTDGVNKGADAAGVKAMLGKASAVAIPVPDTMSGNQISGKTDRAVPLDDTHCTLLELDRGTGLTLAKPCKPVKTTEINSQLSKADLLTFPKELPKK